MHICEIAGGGQSNSPRGDGVYIFLPSESRSILLRDISFLNCNSEGGRLIGMCGVRYIGGPVSHNSGQSGGGEPKREETEKRAFYLHCHEGNEIPLTGDESNYFKVRRIE